MLGDLPQKVTSSKVDGRDGGGSDVNGSSKSAAQNDALHKQYGLLGLLSVIQMTDPDRNVLALGSDLTTLGLNLNSSKSLHSKFSSPWVDGHAATEPQFNLPSCYHMQTPPPLKHAHLQKFQLETLFLIFYSMPKDILQAYAAQELYHRDWRYHTDLKLWFRRATPQDLPQVHADRAQSQFVFFDINSWECRLFSGIAHVVSAGLMSEEDVNVRLPTHSS
jgi:CCR4-NOT transcription complex subunit 2